MKIVTGYKGEPHISSNDMQGFNQSIVGTGEYIFNIGQKFAATITNVNTVTISDGEGIMQGVHFRIAPGQSETVNIANGTTGTYRKDLICARYTKDSVTGIEDVSLVVIQGEEVASSPEEPTYNTGDILEGDSPVDFPLYTVSLSGLTPTLIKKFNIDYPSYPVKLPMEYSSNSYVAEADFNRLAFYQVGRVILACLNLQISSSPGTTWRKIGKVSFPSYPVDTLNLTVANQKNSYNLLLQVDTNGDVKIYSNGTATGWYRTTGFMIL